jgi:hypothetical protein
VCLCSTAHRRGVCAPVTGYPVRRLLLVGRYPPACCSSRLPVFLLRLLQSVNGAQCQPLSLAVLLAWLEPSYQAACVNSAPSCWIATRRPARADPLSSW